MWAALEKIRYPVLLLILGSGASFLAFYQILELKPLKISPSRSTNWTLLFLGVGLIGSSLVGAAAPVLKGHLFQLRKKKSKLVAGEDLKLCLGPAVIDVQFGRLEALAKPQPDSVVVLPANEYFDDECIRDSRSALGAFVQSVFPERIPDLEQCISQQLASAPSQEVDRERGVRKASYGVGTTVLLDRPLGSDHKILFAAVTSQRAGEGLRAEIQTIFQIVNQVCRVVADKRLDQVWMPLLGSGHGGLKREVALMCTVLAWAELVCRPMGRRVRVHLVVFQSNAETAPEIPKDTVSELMASAAGLFGAS